MNQKCRLCLVKVEPDSCTSIFSVTKTGQMISEILINFASIQIAESDCLPTMLCTNCEDKVNIIIDFRAQILTTDSVLRKQENLQEINEERNSLIYEEIKIENHELSSFVECNFDNCEDKLLIRNSIHTVNTNNYFCEVCKNEFTSERLLRNHEEIHDEDKPFKCYECDRAYKLHSMLTKHNKIFHSETRYKCEVCEKTFDVHSSFQEHWGTHMAGDLMYFLNEHPLYQEERKCLALIVCKLCAVQENNEETDSDDSETTPPHIFKDISAATMHLLPDKSKEKYLKEYSLFKEWCKQKKAKKVTENIVLAYFFEKAKLLKASSLWSKYSMLKTTLAVNDNIDIKFPKLLAFLKRQSAGYKAKKSETFTRDDINKFLLEAPDEKFLMMKVALVVGITGACRCDELKKMSIDDIQDKGSILIVKIPDSKTRIQRTFVVEGETSSGLNIVEIYRKYVALRSPKTEHRRFFVTYKAGKCTDQVVGKNMLAKIPRIIAEFLQKPNLDAYTGHCLRRTSAALLVDAGANVLSLKRHGGWKSTTIAEGYVDESVNKRWAANDIIQEEKSRKEWTGESTGSSGS